MAPGAWESLSQAGRDELLKNLAGLARDFSYNGMLIRTSEGRPVANWLNVGGAAGVWKMGKI